MHIVAALLEKVASGHGREANPANYFAAVNLTDVRGLPLQQRLCLALRYVVGLTVAETADTMSTSEAAVKAMEYRASVGLATQTAGAA